MHDPSREKKNEKIIDKIGMAATRERVWRKFRIDHVRVPGHHQLEKRNGTHQWSRAVFQRSRSPERKMGDAEPGRNENAFRFRTDSEKRQVIAKESRKVLNLVPAFENLSLPTLHRRDPCGFCLLCHSSHSLHSEFLRYTTQWQNVNGI